MPHTFLDISLSLDGFAAGPDISHQNPLGVNGEALHAWLFGNAAHQPNEADRKAASDVFAGTGAFILGRTTFNVGEPLWGDDGAFGRPCFVLTSSPRPRHVKGLTTFDFITDGPAAALNRARAAAGEKSVCVMGGPTTARQFVEAGLIDEMRIHLAPVLLGRGTRLFDTLPGMTRLTAAPAISTPLATHLRFTR